MDAARQLLAADDDDNPFSPVTDQFLLFHWINVVVCFALLVYYLYEYRVKSCGWEVVYICIVDGIVYLFEIIFHGYAPANVYVKFGGYDDPVLRDVVWLRYAGWIVTTPVLLMHVNDLVGTGEKTPFEFHRERLMIMANQLTLIIGISGSFADNGYAQALFFFLSFCCFTFQNYHAFNIYHETMRTFPLKATPYLKVMALIYFGFWHVYPLLWALGPEAAGFITPNGSRVLHSLADLFAKNLWGFLAFYVREKILPEEAAKRGMEGGEFILHGRIEDLARQLARAQRSGAKDKHTQKISNEISRYVDSGTQMGYNSFTGKSDVPFMASRLSKNRDRPSLGSFSYVSNDGSRSEEELAVFKESITAALTSDIYETVEKTRKSMEEQENSMEQGRALAPAEEVDYGDARARRESMWNDSARSLPSLSVDVPSFRLRKDDAV